MHANLEGSKQVPAVLGYFTQLFDVVTLKTVFPFSDTSGRRMFALALAAFHTT